MKSKLYKVKYHSMVPFLSNKETNSKKKFSRDIDFSISIPLPTQSVYYLYHDHHFRLKAN